MFPHHRLLNYKVSWYVDMNKYYGNVGFQTRRCLESLGMCPLIVKYIAISSSLRWSLPQYLSLSIAHSLSTWLSITVDHAFKSVVSYALFHSSLDRCPINVSPVLLWVCECEWPTAILSPNYDWRNQTMLLRSTVQLCSFECCLQYSKQVYVHVQHALPTIANESQV